LIRSYCGIYPKFGAETFVAESAEVIGDVTIGSHSSVWFNATVRGDVNSITIGEASNIQDNAVVHVTGGTGPVRIGDSVTIGHNAVVHGCTLRDRVLVGIGAIVLDNAVVSSDCIIGAGTLVTQRMKIPPGSMVIGSPARVVRDLSDEEIASLHRYAEKYVRYSAIYRRDEGLAKLNP
jgi:carbonic anhydrase/acetyltransferase-like protein (isoleucine patch superfamily)